jgi:hypothetical protein
MSSSTVKTLTEQSKKLAYLFSGILLLLVVAIKYFVQVTLLPTSRDFMDIYIPAKSGGTNHFVSGAEFNTISLIAIAGAIGFTVLVSILIKMDKPQGVFVTMMAYFFGGLTYLAIILGNAFHELWGGAWSIAGVVLAVAVVFGMEFIYLRNAYRAPKHPSIK